MATVTRYCPNPTCREQMVTFDFLDGEVIFSDETNKCPRCSATLADAPPKPLLAKRAQF